MLDLIKELMNYLDINIFCEEKIDGKEPKPRLPKQPKPLHFTIQTNTYYRTRRK